jgi:hypothetical protein
VSSERYNPRLTVHVFWGTESPNSMRSQLGRELYEFLCRPLKPNVAVKPGVGIPVYVGGRADRVVASMKQAAANRGPDQACVVAVPLLDNPSRADSQFCEALDELWEVGADPGGRGGFGSERGNTFRFPGLGTQLAFYLGEGICEIHTGFPYQISRFRLQDGVSLSC